MQKDSSAQLARRDHIPGEAGVWILIFGDMVIFAIFFMIFLYYRGQNPSIFTASQRFLSQPLGVLNSFFMLTGSWFVASGIHLARTGRNRTTAAMFLLASLCGVGFVIVKFVEYSNKLRLGITFHSNIFFTCYYMFTGIHLLHVLIGITMLCFMARASGRGSFTPRKLAMLEVGASFWHLVDLLWIVLFALFYLVH